MFLAGLRKDCIQGCCVDRVGCHGEKPLGSDEGIENHNYEMGNPDRVEVLVTQGMKELKAHCKKVHKIRED